jgi:hypothetical protein
MSSPETPEPEPEILTSSGPEAPKGPEVRKATAGMALMAILILFLVGVAIGFVLGRTV